MLDIKKRYFMYHKNKKKFVCIYIGERGERDIMMDKNGKREIEKIEKEKK